MSRGLSIGALTGIVVAVVVGAWVALQDGDEMKQVDIVEEIYEGHVYYKEDVSEEELRSDCADRDGEVNECDQLLACRTTEGVCAAVCVMTCVVE